MSPITVRNDVATFHFIPGNRTSSGQLQSINSLNWFRSHHYCHLDGNEMYTIFYSEKLKGRDNSEDLDVDGRIILKWALTIGNDGTN
jgi:hypothetical protein